MKDFQTHIMYTEKIVISQTELLFCGQFWLLWKWTTFFGGRCIISKKFTCPQTLYDLPSLWGHNPWNTMSMYNFRQKYLHMCNYYINSLYDYLLMKYCLTYDCVENRWIMLCSIKIESKIYFCYHRLIQLKSNLVNIICLLFSLSFWSL